MEGGAAGGPGHCAFQLWVGNVPFDASEVELKNVLSVAGRVLGVRVKYDAESGQSKGFGFVDFPDLESCLLLLQQQQQQPIELRGRKLKLDWATAELREAYGSGTNAIGVAGGRQTKEAKWSRAASRPEISGGKTRVIGLSGAATAGLSGSRAASGGAAAAAAASLMGYSPSDPFAAAPGVLPSFVCEFMQCLSTSHLLQLLHHMQQLAQQHPHGCRRFLTDNPSLTYALLFAMYLVGAVSSKDLTTADLAQPGVLGAPAAAKGAGGAPEGALLAQAGDLSRGLHASVGCSTEGVNAASVSASDCKSWGVFSAGGLFFSLRGFACKSPSAESSGVGSTPCGGQLSGRSRKGTDHVEQVAGGGVFFAVVLQRLEFNFQPDGLVDPGTATAGAVSTVGSTTAGVPSGHVARRNTSEATLYIEGIKGLLFYSVLRAEAGTRVAAVLLQDMQNATDVKPNALCV
ncbi:mRNA processing [Cyclospora cayetanensis]|uniref:mRNA processing n=1 Tax=Cyclospora cayetanensis TaxID=88456 RepID=A0A1D3CYY6_9EIME|nr:mRNA processing [Cyclospora cayetanensis]